MAQLFCTRDNSLEYAGGTNYFSDVLGWLERASLLLFGAPCADRDWRTAKSSKPE